VSDLTVAAFVPDGNSIFSLAGDGTLRFWDNRVGESPSPRELESRRLTCANARTVSHGAFSPDGTTVVVGTDEGVLCRVELRTGQRQCEPWPATDGHIRLFSVGFSPASDTIISTATGGVRVWNAATCKQRGQMLRVEGRAPLFDTAAMSPDSRIVASGALDDGTVFVWDAISGTLRTELLGHKQGVIGVSFSPDGKTIVSAAEDGELRLWAAATGQAVGLPMQAHARITSVTFSPDNKMIVTGNKDGTVHVWDAPAGWIDRVCAKLVRNLSRAEWKQYVGDIPYVEQCPGLPVPKD